MTSGATQGRKATSMFKDAETFTSFSTNDLQKAKDFYGGTLGLDVSEMTEGLQIKLADGHGVFLYPKHNHEPATYTVLNFHVDNIDNAVDELKELGVSLEHYDLPGLKTDEKGIFRHQGPQIAWFKDPAGNILSVIERS